MTRPKSPSRVVCEFGPCEHQWACEIDKIDWNIKMKFVTQTSCYCLSVLTWLICSDFLSVVLHAHSESPNA